MIETGAGGRGPATGVPVIIRLASASPTSSTPTSALIPFCTPLPMRTPIQCNPVNATRMPIARGLVYGAQPGTSEMKNSAAVVAA